MSTPLAPSDAPAPGRRQDGRGWRLAGFALAAVAGTGLAGWMIAGYLHRPHASALDELSPAASGGAAGAPRDLASEHYNAVLQVRLKGEQGEMVAVGTLLARKLTLTLTDAAGRSYAEVFDRVGLWAIEVPPGAYLIPLEQPDLAHWKWTLKGEALRVIPGKGYGVDFAAGRVNPTLDLLLQ